MLGEGPPDDINGTVGTAKKKFSINYSRAKTKFWLSLHYNGGNSYLFVNGKEIFKFKANNKNVNFPIQFCLAAYLKNLMLFNLEKNLIKQMCLIFQSIMVLLIMTYDIISISWIRII